MPEQKVIKCPFCEIGEITILYTPTVMVTKYARASSNRKAITYPKPEKYQVVTEKCPNCGKPKKGIKKALEEGIPITHEEVIRRAKASGLPLKF